jgi:hypothetical protein
MATDLAQWFGDLLGSTNAGNQPDWDELEVALVRLRQRVAEQDLQIEALDPEDPIREQLFRMGDYLHQVCEELDGFLETEDADHLRKALDLALAMQEMSQDARRQMDEESQEQRLEL